MMPGSLEGRQALITGASEGLGLAIARAFVEAGASVMMCARNSDKLKRARTEVGKLAIEGQRVLARTADVSEAEDVAALVQVSLVELPELSIVVNNAGIYGPKGVIEDVPWAAWVEGIAINLFGSVLVCREVVPHLRKRRYGKIIQLSGGGATNPLPRLSSYAASKAAVVRFAETLAEEVREDGVDVNCIAPGALNTRLLDEVLAAGPERVGHDLYARALKQRDSGGAPLDAGARLAVFLASPASDGITGKLFSALWDPWHTFAEHTVELRQSDVYTLRRIVPKDRGLRWG